jgi:SAM-dependent methyltransferase
VDPGPRYRFYGDLAPWWPLISPPEHYADEAAFLRTLLPAEAHDLLELGSGGGHNAVYLKRGLTLTLVDLSAEMLEVSRALNPECQHVVGDMRTVRLGRTFDAVVVHDAIDYMTTEEDLATAIATVAAHCRTGATVVFVPDHVADTFVPYADHGGTDAPDGRGVRYLEWTVDPDPTDTWITTDYAFLFRHADGRVERAHETHRTGLFERTTWLRLLTEAGFDADVVLERTTEPRAPREYFVGRAGVMA